ncbi:HPr-rel-A system PqqD family peptide chaperone [Malonomonas rubra]|uniref:HPr-rel-A system PqqD family peptide chaperone n=1 Tax=Malonomonas rubra TaxID=57040 RepID=UPI00137B08C1|nr:HPr-rel-A system PqqD family peptide chaperone [Malonomonas rubra]
MQSFPSKWKICEGLRLVWRQWGDEFVVYHSGSADVHLLSPVVVSILRKLQAGPNTLNHLASELAIANGPKQTEEADVKEIIRLLNNLCLVEPCSS